MHAGEKRCCFGGVIPFAGRGPPKLGQLKLRINTLTDLPSRTRYARIGAALGEGVRCPIMG